MTRPYRPKTELVAFGDRLWNLIDERGWSQAELSERSGLTHGAISTYINARRRPGFDALWRMHDALGCTWEELMGE